MIICSLVLLSDRHIVWSEWSLMQSCLIDHALSSVHDHAEFAYVIMCNPICLDYAYGGYLKGIYCLSNCNKWSFYTHSCQSLLSSDHFLWSNVQTCLNDHYMVLMVTYAVMSDWSMIMPHLVLVISPHPSTAILSSCYWLVREIIMISQQICLCCHDLQSAQWSFCGLIQKDMPHLVKSDLALHYLSDLAIHYLSDHAWSCVKDYA